MTVSSIANNAVSIFSFPNEKAISKAKSFIVNNAQTIVITAVVLVVLTYLPTVDANKANQYGRCSKSCSDAFFKSKLPPQGRTVSDCINSCMAGSL